MSDNLSRNSEMSDVVAAIDPRLECKSMTHEVGRTLPASLGVGARIHEVARTLKLWGANGERLVRAAWYEDGGPTAYFEIKPRFDSWQRRRSNAIKTALNTQLTTLFEAMHESHPDRYRRRIADIGDLLGVGVDEAGPGGGQS